MPERKAYSPPQVVRVELNHEQAILSVCSLTAATAAPGTTAKCRNGGCKKAGGGFNNAGRPS
nr:hypothetical protein [Nitrospirota bacterium]